MTTTTTSTLVNRVPQIVLSYWVIKVASTTLGETGADMVSMSLDFGYAATIGVFAVVFATLLALKLRLRRYTPWSYWSVFTASAVLGTALSDFIDRTLGLGYALGAALLSLLLLATLAVWRRTQGSLAVERIETAGAEVFYWFAFLVANTLGTAVGDYVSDELGVGFLISAVGIAALLGLAALARVFTSVSRVFLFWFAFVLTRPFGATFGDLLTKPVAGGGLALGTFGASAFFAAVMVVALWRETRRHRSSDRTP